MVSNVTRVTIEMMVEKKKSGRKITMLTAYDHPLASLVDRAGIDIILVGDSLANVVMGLNSTKDVGMTEMIHHAKAARRGVTRALLVGDMPYEAYQKDAAHAVANAKRFVDDAGCDAVKIEWFDECPEVAEAIIVSGIPVMGHVGLTPQTAEKLGGFKVQGKDAASARKIMDNALVLQKKGCFSLVLECIPSELAAFITKTLAIPTIGIGAGVHCDGQVLVTYDLLGLFDKFTPKFVKKYLDLSGAITQGILSFKEDVESGKFPDVSRSYTMNPEELNQLTKERQSNL